MSSDRASIPILSALIPDGIASGTPLVVEYDPESQWFAVATTITARYVQMGCHVNYIAIVRSREKVRNDLAKLGLNVAASEKAGLLQVDDWYTATLGLQSGMPEQVQSETGSYFRIDGLKVAEMSVFMLKQLKDGSSAVVDTWPTGSLDVMESNSPILRFNDEKSTLEWLETRIFPVETRAGKILLEGIARGVHSEAFYRRMEHASEGVIEVRVMERGEEAKNVLRVRSLRGQPHDARWHEIEIKPNGEAVLSS